MARYVGHAVDQYGRDIPGAYVTVVGMDGLPATLTDDFGNAISQPLRTDDYGGYYFNTSDGLYTITTTRSGETIAKEYNVVIGILPTTNGFDIALAAEASERVAGDALVASNAATALAGEVTRATAAEQAEVTRATGVETGLDTRLTTAQGEIDDLQTVSNLGGSIPYNTYADAVADFTPYASGTAYTVGKRALDQGAVWIDILAGTGVAPPTLPTTSNANWQLVKNPVAGQAIVIPITDTGSHTDPTTGTTVTNTGIHVWATGTSGTGFHYLYPTDAALAKPYADAAATSATLAGHFANDSTDVDVPGGSPGDRGAKFWSLQASSTLAIAYATSDKVGAVVYQPTVIGNPTSAGASSANAGTLRVNTGASFAVAGPLNSIRLKASVAGTATLLVGPVSGTTFTPALAFNVTCTTGENTFSLPSASRVQAGWYVGFWSATGQAQLAFDAGGISLSLVASSVSTGTPYAMTAGGALLAIQANYGVIQGVIEPRVEILETSVAALNAAFSQTQTIGAPASATLVSGAGGASTVTYVEADQIASSGTIATLRVYQTSASAGTLTFGLFSKSGANFTLVGSSTTITVPGGAGTKTISLAISGAAGLYLGFSPSSGVMSFLVGAAYGSGYYSSLTTGFQSSFTDRNSGVPNTGVQLQIGFDVSYIPSASSSSSASVRDLVTSASPSFSGLTISVSGVLTRDNSPLNFSGSAALTAIGVSSASNVATNFAGGTLALGWAGSSSTAFALMNAVGYLPKAHLTNLVVKDASSGTTLTLGTDYLANTEHGAIGLAASGSTRNVTASYNYTQVRYDLIYVDSEALTIGVVQGTPRDRDVAEYLPVPNAGTQKPLCYARVVGGAITSVIPAYDVEGGIRRKYAADLAERRRLNRKALRKTFGRLRAGTPFNLVGYGDSITAIQRNGPSPSLPNGIERDRITSGAYQSYAGYSDTNGTIPLYTAVQMGRPADSEGQVYSKIGWNWELIAGFQERYPNAQITYQNMGIASTTSSNTDKNGVVNGTTDPLNGSNSNRLPYAAALAANGLAVICFGQNGMGAAGTMAEMVTIIQAFQAQGADVIVMGVTQPNLLAGKTPAVWEFTNRAVEDAADFCGVAFAPTFAVANSDNIGVLGLDLLDCSAANFTNHPFLHEFKVYGELLRLAVME